MTTERPNVEVLRAALESMSDAEAIDLIKHLYGVRSGIPVVTAAPAPAPKERRKRSGGDSDNNPTETHRAMEEYYSEEDAAERWPEHNVEQLRAILDERRCPYPVITRDRDRDIKRIDRVITQRSGYWNKDPDGTIRSLKYRPRKPTLVAAS